jgi:hypothetical protein
LYTKINKYRILLFPSPPPQIKAFVSPSVIALRNVMIPIVMVLRPVLEELEPWSEWGIFSSPLLHCSNIFWVITGQTIIGFSRYIYPGQHEPARRRIFNFYACAFNAFFLCGPLGILTFLVPGPL